MCVLVSSACPYQCVRVRVVMGWCVGVDVCAIVCCVCVRAVVWLCVGCVCCQGVRMRVCVIV